MSGSKEEKLQPVSLFKIELPDSVTYSRDPKTSRNSNPELTRESMNSSLPKVKKKDCIIQ